MALPLLVAGGADCGPSNALQGLTKRFDHDRGIQQDHFGASRAGSSREVFRSQQPTTSQDQDAARFFAPTNASSPFVAPAYDLSAMRAALPTTPLPQFQPNPFSAWASDFIHAQPASSQKNMDIQVDAPQSSVIVPQGAAAAQAQWNPALSNFRMPAFTPQIPMHMQQHQQQHQPAVHTKRISWDREFTAQELHLTPVQSQISHHLSQEQNQETHQPSAGEADELARTAGMLLDNIKHEQNPKFQNSQFLGLMKQLRDREVVVQGNQMVESDGLTASSSSSQIDIKGKGRSTVIPPTSSISHTHVGNLEHEQEEDANDAYFRQENAEFTRYWNDTQEKQGFLPVHSNTETVAWDKLQADWDNFEATASGIKAIDGYRFQANNPYLLGESESRTRAHLMHVQGREAVLENVLELEASVQRNMLDARAWYELGVKQQENEREHKALQALQRAVELDPTHLPARLALAISYTNDNNRQGTFDAINEWVSRNERYHGAVAQFRAAQTVDGRNLSLMERYARLIQCLITMARSETTAEVDADIQIALAVLLNTNEEYEKAQDCFKTALAVRPDDWLLYNRVGATMANSGRPEEALEYYYRALELNPGYIRARFNLGISCINLRRYEEAAQYILDALVLQDSDGVRESAGAANEKRGVVSTALWDSLKTTCLHMQRADLATLCDLKDLEGFRTSFQYFGREG